MSALGHKRPRKSAPILANVRCWSNSDRFGHESEMSLCANSCHRGVARGGRVSCLPNPISISNLYVGAGGSCDAIELFCSFETDESQWGASLQKLVISLLATASLVIAACTPEAAKKDDEQICASKLYPNYDVSRLDQCMAVCKACRGGTTVTCSTSCKLKGSS